jgi:hypothetical protein
VKYTKEIDKIKKKSQGTGKKILPQRFLEKKKKWTHIIFFAYDKML